MGQPPDYTRQYNFNDFQTSSPSDPLPGLQVDAELNEVKQTLDGLNTNIGLIQRDDGKLGNGSVHKDAFDGSALAIINAGSYTSKGNWATATAYSVGDLVNFNDATYFANSAHTSSAAFSTDLTASRWILLANAAISGTSFAVDKFEGDGSTVAFTLSYSYQSNNSVQVYVNGELRNPGDDYTISGTTLTLSTAPSLPAVSGNENVIVWGPPVVTQSAITAAAQSASNASGFADEAESWATKTDGTVDGTNYSAKYWATQADVGTVAGISSAISTNASNITAINTNATNITAIQGASGNASTASTKASEASASAASALSAKNAAESARDSALAAYDSFDDRYLGVFTTANQPTLDNDGNALISGALYFDSTDEAMQVYAGSVTGWVAAYASLAGALLVSNNLSDVNNAATAATNIGLGTNDSPTFSGLTINGNIAATGTVDGRDVASDGSKLDNIEENATADMTASEIEAIVDHDSLQGFVANEHIDWTTDQGETNIHSGNYTDTTYSAGTGITLNGTTFSNSMPDQVVALTSGSNVTVSGTYPNFTIASTDTTYTVGDGGLTKNNFTDADHDKLDAIDQGVATDDDVTFNSVKILNGSSQNTILTGGGYMQYNADATSSQTYRGHIFKIRGVDWLTMADYTSGSDDKITSKKKHIFDAGAEVTGNITVTGNISFEGATANNYETTVTVTDPTADRTITLPNASGTVMVQDSSGYVTGGSSSANMILQGSNPNFKLIDTDADASRFDIFNDYQGDDTYIVSVDNNDEKTNSSLLIRVDSEDVASFDTTGVDVTGRLQVANGSTSSGYIDLLEDSDNGTNKIKLEAPQAIASDKTITLPDETGQVVLSSGAVGTDATALIGRGKIGYCGSSDVFSISHEDHGTSNLNLGFGQSQNGYSWINSTNGAYSSLRVLGNNILQAHATEIIANQDIRLDTNKNLVFEGATADGYETTVTVTDPTADQTITLPNASGTITTRAHAVAFANMLG